MNQGRNFDCGLLLTDSEKYAVRAFHCLLNMKI